jgi:hypothetical protein
MARWECRAFLVSYPVRPCHNLGGEKNEGVPLHGEAILTTRVAAGPLATLS